MRLFHFVWLTILTLFALLFFGYEHINDFIENTLTKKLKVPVRIGYIDYSFAFADIPFFELRDLRITNPSGAVLPDAFSCSAMVFKTPFARYFDKQIVIQNLIVVNPYFSFEFDSPESANGNWTKLMNNLKETIDKAAPKDRSVLIEKLILHNINADLLYNSDETKKVESLPFIREIILTDIRGSGSTAINDILTIVFQESLEAVLSSYKIKNRFGSQDGKTQKPSPSQDRSP